MSISDSSSDSPGLNMMSCSVLTYETEVGGRFGRKTEKQVPQLSGCTRLRIRMDPPSRSAISRATHRPSPVPFSPLVVKNGSKMRAVLWGAIPHPMSARVTRSPSTVGDFLQSADWLTRSAKRPPIGTASIALISRVENICRISPG